MQMKKVKPLLLIPVLILALPLLLSTSRSCAYAGSGQQIDTGRTEKADYAQRMKAVAEQVAPKEGYQTKLILGDLVPRMVALGIIDMAKMEELYKARGGLSPEQKQMLTHPSTVPLSVNADNATWLVNILWPLGLANKMVINKRSPIAGRHVNDFASAGGWQLGREKNGGAYFNRHDLIPLTAKQQQRVWRLATATYRPCCDNSTFFQDCNHGSAAMAILEMGVSQGLSDEEIYRTLLAFNSYWFEQNYLETALYFNVIKKTDWNNVDPKLALSRNYSSLSRWLKNVHAAVSKVPGLLPETETGGTCGA